MVGRLGIQESVYRAAIAKLVPISRRGTVHGLFNTMLGLGTLLSGIIFGFLLDIVVHTIVVFGHALLAQTCALLALRGGKALFSGHIRHETELT